MSPRSALALVAALALGALALIAIFVRRDGAVAPNDGAPSLVRALDDLNETQLRMLQILEHIDSRLGSGLGDRLGNGPGSAGVDSEAVSPAGESVTELSRLIQGIETLRETVELEALRTQEWIRTAAVAPGPTDLVEARDLRPEADWERLGGLEQAWRADPSRADRSQYFQSAHDLLERYGPPSAIYRPKGGGMLLVYRKHPEGTAGPAWYFRYQDGMVVEFFLEDEEGDPE